ncbi:hypothetical protein GCM10023187_07680 [Nibrella viscosa]|uniref:DUF1772 domain-containing protein n=1 Tax=Nibrella viscosa TaxID=1084524 RepID=A0ABP8JY46_9BACT
MPFQSRFLTVILWLFVINMGIELGGGLYEIQVITPIVTYNPPESVIQFFNMQKTHPEQAIQAGRRFWKFTSQPLGLLAVSVLILGVRARGNQRKWLLSSSLLVILLFLVTYLYFVPTLNQLANSRQLGLRDEEVISQVTTWMRLNQIRLLVYMLAWLAGLRALTYTALQTRIS